MRIGRARYSVTSFTRLLTRARADSGGNQTLLLEQPEPAVPTTAASASAEQQVTAVRHDSGVGEGQAAVGGGSGGIGGAEKGAEKVAAQPQPQVTTIKALKTHMFYSNLVALAANEPRRISQAFLGASRSSGNSSNPAASGATDGVSMQQQRQQRQQLQAADGHASSTNSLPATQTTTGTDSGATTPSLLSPFSSPRRGGDEPGGAFDGFKAASEIVDASAEIAVERYLLTYGTPPGDSPLCPQSPYIYHFEMDTTVNYTGIYLRLYIPRKTACITYSNT
eukprot:COSAG05_NODE_311_length_11636_cov_11.922250_20_plen_280_part_00